MLWPFKFLESFRCSIPRVCIYYTPESDIRVTSYHNLDFSRAFVVQFRAFRYIMRLNRTFGWKVMTIWIAHELPLFNFECLDILCARIRHPCEKSWQFEFLETFCCWISSVSMYYVPELYIRVKSHYHLNFSRASVVQFRASRYIMRLNRTSEWKVMTIWISRQLPLFNFERLNILCPQIVRPWENYYHLNFSRASVVEFRASRYIMCLNRTTKWKVLTIWIAWQLPLFYFKRLDIFCTWIGHPCEKLWLLQFLESFRCYNSSV